MALRSSANREGIALLLKHIIFSVDKHPRGLLCVRLYGRLWEFQSEPDRCGHMVREP